MNTESEKKGGRGSARSLRSPLAGPLEHPPLRVSTRGIIRAENEVSRPRGKSRPAHGHRLAATGRRPSGHRVGAGADRRCGSTG